MKIRHTLTVALAMAIVVGMLVSVRGTQHVQANSFRNPTVLLSTVHSKSADVPPGTYTTTITEADLQFFPPEIIALLVGEWQMELTEDGSNLVSKDGEIIAIGRYTSTPFHLVISDLEGPLACTDAPGIATGVYRWSFDNDALTFDAVNDRCIGRQTILMAHAWEMQ